MVAPSCSGKSGPQTVRAIPSIDQPFPAAVPASPPHPAPAPSAAALSVVGKPYQSGRVLLLLLPSPDISHVAGAPSRRRAATTLALSHGVPSIPARARLYNSSNAGRLMPLGPHV
jgi:hypothetical protein